MRNNPDERLKIPVRTGRHCKHRAQMRGRRNAAAYTGSPRSPSLFARGRVQGTRGIWMEDNASVYVEGASEPHKWDPQDKWFKVKYEHPLWRWFKTST